MNNLYIRRFLATAVIALPSGLSAIDTDSDGLDDAVETNTGVYVSPTNTGTKPAVADSDGDGAGDWYEIDRLTPYAAMVRDTPEELLDDLDLVRLLEREDVIPPVPGEQEEEEY